MLMLTYGYMAMPVFGIAVILCRRGCCCSRLSPRQRRVPPVLARLASGHPIVAMVSAGVRVTINSDDPPMFATTLNGEYAVAARLLGLDDVGVGNLAKAAVRASFAERPFQEQLLAEIDAYLVGSA